MAVPFLPYIGKKGKSRMVSKGFVAWYNVPAREFPARRWLEQRYPFRISPAVFARRAGVLAASASGRRFPALVWLEVQARLRA